MIGKYKGKSIGIPGGLRSIERLVFFSLKFLFDANEITRAMKINEISIVYLTYINVLRN